MKLALVLLSFLLLGSAVAHEMTPTYPELGVSHVDGVLKAELQMFNKREDVEYYELGVFDADWEPIPFVSNYKILRLNYLGHVRFDVYVRKVDADRAAYVCSKSMLRREKTTEAVVSSKICSKFKH